MAWLQLLRERSGPSACGPGSAITDAAGISPCVRPPDDGCGDAGRGDRSPSRSQLGDCVTETVYRHELRPVIRSGANATDRLFPAPEPGRCTGAAVRRNKTRTTDDATCLGKSCQAMYQVAAAGSIFTGADLANAASPGPANPRGPGGPAAPGPAGTNELARSRGGRVRSDSCRHR